MGICAVQIQACRQEVIRISVRMTTMNFVSVLKYAVYAVSSAAMVVGVLVMMGNLVPRYFPANYRVVIGAVVFLYGAYRFGITYVRSRRVDGDEE